MQLGTALNLPNPRINFGGSGAGSGKGKTAIFSFETGVLDPSINFSRTTNATVTNSAGLITYAPHNLLTYSEQFDNAAWVAFGTKTVTANTTTAPNGTLTADTFSSPIGNGIYYSATTNSSTTHTASLYCKAIAGTQIRLVGVATSGVIYDNTITISSGQSVGNGWFRVQAVGTTSATDTFIQYRIYSADGNPVYIWGAQLEIGSTATAYNSTTVKNLLGYSELFDNAAWTKSNSFVQTNLLTYSEAFDNAVWNKGAGVSITANSTIAPNGYQTADTITFTGANQVMSIGSSTSISGLVVTGSIYVKGVASETIQIAVGGVDTIVTFTGEWQRVELIKTSIVATTNVFNINTFSGVTARSFTIWGAQLVQGSVAGDYRRTDATALPVYYPNHNGVVCAEKLVSDTATSLHYIREDFIGADNGVYTASVYAKAGEWNSIQLEMITQAGNVKGIVVNLSTGTITMGRVAYPTSYGATALGNGWYRVWITNSNETGVALERVNIFPTNNSVSGNIAGDGTSGIYIFGAQLSDSASLDPYVLNAAAAPTAAAYYGARFDYDAVTLAPKGLLIEEQRANLCVYSGTTSDANWSVSSVAKTSTNNLAPDGSLTAMLATSSGASTNHYVISGNNVVISYTSGTTYTMSCFVKAGTTNLIQLTGSGGVYGNSQYANFLLSGSGSVTASTGGPASIQQYSNGWYRIIFSVAATATTTGVAGLMAFITSGTDTRIPTNTSADNIYMWGFQTEAGAFATSYIPTAASQVTRAADIAIIQGSNFYSWYNQNEGSMFANTTTSHQTQNKGLWSINTDSNNRIDLRTFSSGITIASTNYTPPTINAALVSKTVYAFASFNYGFTRNGATVGLATTPPTLPIVNRLVIGGVESVGNELNGTIKQISYYPQRLSNDVLKGLTA